MATDALAACLADGQSHVRAAAAKAIGLGLNFVTQGLAFRVWGKVPARAPRILYKTGL